MTSQAASRKRKPLKFDPEQGAEGVITGTVICAAVLASAVGLGATTFQLCTAIIGTVVIYWLSHVHAITVGLAVSEKMQFRHAFRRALAHSAPLAVVSLLPLAILLIAELVGASVAAAGTIALIASIALLAIYGYLAGIRGGLGMRGALLSAFGGILLGVLTMALKAGH